MYVLRLQTVRILGCEYRLDRIVSVFNIFFSHKYAEIRYGDDSAETGHFAAVDTLPHFLVGEKYDALAVMGKVGNRIRGELRKQRNDYGLVGVDSKEGDGPAG